MLGARLRTDTLLHRTASGLAVFLLTVFGTADLMAQTSAPAAEDTQGPIRLRQPVPAVGLTPQTVAPQRPVEPANPGEFEVFVQRAASSTLPIKRLGAELVTGEFDGLGGDLSPLVPADYVIAPGDEVLVTIWGSVDADLRMSVDRAGRITLPRVGTVQVAGVRHADLPAVIERRVAQVFRSFQLSATVGQIRGIRVFVTGFVSKPGTYSVNNLSTVVSALMRAGGPSAAGSFRHIELRRGATKLATFDLYDLLLKGDRSGDQILQAGDVVHVGPVGAQVGVIGSVNKQAVVELKPGETVADVLRMAGGFTAVADRTRLLIERLQDRPGERAVEVKLPENMSAALSHGDILRAFNVTTSVLSTQFQNKRVRIDGEVRRPGEYLLPANSTLQDALKAAGGLTPAAYLFGTEFSRESVRSIQQENYDRALRDLETEFTRNAATQKTNSSEQAAALAASGTANARLIERLRAVRPTGRVVLALNPESRDLPEMAVEDGDRLYVPARPTTVGVFGSVFNAGSYLLRDGATIGSMMRLAGGPTKGADSDSAFVVRLDGSVLSARQMNSGWFGSRQSLIDSAVLPGDTIFVPEELNKTSFAQEAKEWTQILYQFGLGAAALKTIRGN